MDKKTVQQSKKNKRKNVIPRNYKRLKSFFKKLKEDLNRLKKHQYSDDLDYKGIRQIENLFHKINENYYKPIKTDGAFNENYMEYESRGDKDRNLSLEDYLNIIKPFLKDWKIQLIMRINFISSLDNDELRIMSSKSNNYEGY